MVVNLDTNQRTIVSDVTVIKRSLLIDFVAKQEVLWNKFMTIVTRISLAEILSYGCIFRSFPLTCFFSASYLTLILVIFLRLAWVQIILTEGFHYSLSFFRNLP
jgi:hypothetical protein